MIRRWTSGTASPATAVTAATAKTTGVVAQRCGMADGPHEPAAIGGVAATGLKSLPKFRPSRAAAVSIICSPGTRMW